MPNERRHSIHDRAPRPNKTPKNDDTAIRYIAARKYAASESGGLAMGYNCGVVKPWSISTTVREPKRLPDFLRVLQTMSGEVWNVAAQVEYQTRLVQARLYGAGNQQFYRGLPQRDINLLESGDEVSLADARRIFKIKNYTDAPVRGRTSFKPLEKFGFAALVNRRVQITESGEALMAEADDYADIFMRVLLKWEIPNVLDVRGFPPKHGYNIKPFVGFLRLIDAVNNLCQKSGIKAKGLSSLEVEGFGITLIDYRKINETARDIVELRRRAAKIPHTQRDGFCKGEINRLRSGYDLNNVRDYADNTLRYFRLTKYVRTSEWGNYVNLEPMRQNELSSLFDRDDARPAFRMQSEYAAFLASAEQPDLPGETKPELTKTIDYLAMHAPASGKPAKAVIARMNAADLKQLRNSLRASIAIAAGEKEKAALRDPVEVENCINELENLKNRKGKGNFSVKLEWLAARGLGILNDAEEIRPNYSLGDDGLPSGNALAGKADIECYYGDFVSICEVTLHKDCKQWIHEAQPVMRHLREFKAKNGGKPAYCLFIAPELHKDTINMFHLCAKGGYENEKQLLAPITVQQFSGILRFAANRARLKNPLTRKDIKTLLDRLAASVATLTTSDKWLKDADRIIEQWKQPR